MNIFFCLISFIVIFNWNKAFSQSTNNGEMPGNILEQDFCELPVCIYYPVEENEKENIDSNQLLKEYYNQNLLLIPNAFTPNGDGLNDNFKIFCNFYESFNLIIYDILGNKLFESDDASNAWDGNCKNKPCKAGAYIWMLSYKTMDGINNCKMGSLTLIK